MGNETITTSDIVEPDWCDPGMCDAGELFLVDQLHVLHGESVQLSLHDREHQQDDEDYVPFIQTFIHQHVGDAAPTLGLHSESVGVDAQPGLGLDLSMTQAEFIALHLARERIIEATASPSTKQRPRRDSVGGGVVVVRCCSSGTTGEITFREQAHALRRIALSRH